MSEYIGSRISLISKSDIRYVGTLVEINSEQSTVALEDVRSFGTEGRRGRENEILPSADPYEYIIFRGSDVKDLRIEETPKESKPAAPPVPNDPAILGSARPPPQRNLQQPDHQPPGPGFAQQPPFGQYPPFPPGFGRGFPGGPGGPGPHGFPPGMPYGAPPGWYPPPGQGFPPQGPIGSQPPQAPGLGPQPQAGGKGPQPSPQAPVAPQQQKLDSAPPKPQDTVKPTSTAPPPPLESKPDIAAAVAPASSQAPRPPTQPKGRVMPAVPLTTKPVAPPTYAAATSAASAPNAAPQLQTATEAATAAVAAAMAKLPGRQKPETSEAMDNLTRKVNEMRTDDGIRHSRQQGTGGYAAGNRGRGGRRGGLRDQTSKPIDIPTTDFDFESANAKFNKQDVVKEAIASGSPIQGPGGANGSTGDIQSNGDALNGSSKADEDVVIPPAAPAYDMKSSFFDNISSELKERDDTTGKKIGGMEFRTEERKRNMETFGQGSVDSYRGGYRGRGRRGFRGRGGFNGRARGPYRGGRGAAQGASFGAPAGNADEL